MEKTTRQEAAPHCSKPLIVTWVIADDGEGQRSICPVSWQMTTSHNPHLIAISLHPQRFTHGLVKKAGEFVLAFAAEDQAEATLEMGTHSGRDYDKFAKHALTALPGASVKSPLIEECIVNLECKVVGELTTGDHTIFAGEVLHYWAAGDDRRPLLSVNDSGGYQQLMKGKGYQLGVVQR